MNGAQIAPLGDLRAFGIFRPENYGGKGDGAEVYDAAITTGTGALATSATFSSGDVGKQIRVAGAGSAGADLVTTISGFTDTHHVALTVNAATTVSGAIATYGTDDSTSIQAAIAAAGAYAVSAAAKVLFSKLIYFADSLLLSQHLVNLAGVAGGTAYYGFGGKPGFSTRIMQLPSSSNTLLSCAFTGNKIENLGFDGNGRSGTGTLLAVTYGMVMQMENVTCIDGGGIGLDITGSQNMVTNTTWIYRCGSSTKPAVRITPIDDTHFINSLTMHMLDIEASYGVPLEIGNFVTAGHDAPEFPRFYDLHIEGPTGYPAMRIVNGRSICFINPFIFGGDSSNPVIEYDLSDTAFATANPGVYGGVAIVGGTVCGGSGNPVNLVHLKHGSAFSISGGTRLVNCSGAAVLVDSTFSDQVYIDPHVMTQGVGSVLQDNRAAGTAVTWPKAGVLLGSVVYWPTPTGSATTYNTPTSVTVVDATNISVPIVVPSSANVLVKMNVLVVGVGGTQTSLGVYTAAGAQVGNFQIAHYVVGRIRTQVEVAITGLTPGALTLRMAQVGNASGNSLLIGGGAGPAVMEVYAA